MAGARVRRRNGAQQLEARDADLAMRAGSALLAADERIRITTDDLDFAEAELGADSIAKASEALVAARRQLSDAFRLNRLNHDAMPGTADDVRARLLRIVQLSEGIESALGEQTTALAARIAQARRAPEIFATIRADVAHLRSRIADARDTIDQLAARYAREALARVESNPAEAERLLRFAEHSVGVAERRRDAGRRGQASLALEASVESVRRTATLLDAVETFEVEALRAESMLTATVEESRRALDVALDGPRSRGVAYAIAELQAALAGLPQAGVNTDPFAHLGRLRAALAALEVETESAGEPAEAHPMPHVSHLHHAIENADRKLDIARDAIDGHPGTIGAEALKLLAEAERIRMDLGQSLGRSASAAPVIQEHHREQARSMAERVALLASEALNLARRDIGASRRDAVGLRGRSGD